MTRFSLFRVRVKIINIRRVEDLERGGAGDVGRNQVDIEGHQDEHAQLREQKRQRVRTGERQVAPI